MLCPLGTNKPGSILGLVRFCVFQADKYFYVGKSPKFHDFFFVMGLIKEAH
jgi:hypothetical protein